MSQLDDLKLIHQKDPQDALGVVEKQWQQLKHEFGVNFEVKDTINNVVVGGMGGSGWPATYVNSWPGLKVPFEICRSYTLPNYVGPNTLFVASSYSGNTEETLTTLAEAESRGAQIAVITSGGNLKQIAEEKNYPLYVLPTGTQPRMCSLYFIAAYLELLTPLGLVDESALNSRHEVADWLRDNTGDWRADIPTSKNLAKQLALELMGKTVIVYAGPLLAPVANKIKICMNENAKNLAWWNEYPEFNHNEFIGWTSHPVNKPFAVLEIRSNLEHERIQKRFEVSERLLSGQRPAPHVITPEGDTLPKQIFWASVFGDYVSVYLALLNGVNPTPVDLVEKFKAALN